MSRNLSHVVAVSCLLAAVAVLCLSKFSLAGVISATASVTVAACVLATRPAKSAR